MKKGDYVTIKYPKDLDTYQKKVSFAIELTDKHMLFDKVFQIQWTDNLFSKISGIKKLVPNEHLELVTNLYEDASGKRLNINDEVLYIRPGARELKKGFIKSLGPVMATIVDKIGDDYGDKRDYKMIAKI